jgi:tetratricopeptide (TPR) repeat protein
MIMGSHSAAAMPKNLEPSPASARSRLFFSAEKRVLPLALLLVAAVVIGYSPVAHNGFINFDDDTYITLNPHVKAGLARSTVTWAFTTFDVANYHPLTWLSHALDCQLFGLDAGAHHEVNVLLHAVNAALVFLLLQSLTGMRWRSLLVAALFALHPVNVESVAWAAERKNVLSMLFFLLALQAYTAYARRPKPATYALVSFLFALALLSKPQVITLPFVLLMLDYWPLYRFANVPAAGESLVGAAPRTSLPWLILEKLPLFALAAASAVLTIKAQNAGGAVQNLSQYSPLLRVETAIVSYARYLSKALWPTNLVALYPHPTQLYPAWQAIAAALLLSLITAAVLWKRNHPYLAVGWFWFLGTLVPMIGLMQVGAQAIADRYAYISFLGLFTMATWLVADLARARRFPRLAVAALGFAAVLVLSVLTYRQVGYWHDPESFWTRTIKLTDNNYVAHDTLAQFLLETGRADEAAAHYRAAIAIRPDDLPAHLALGTYEHAHGNLNAAIQYYQFVATHAAHRALRATALGNLGSAYRQLGKYSDAKRFLEASLELVPNRPMALVGLGLIAHKSADFPEAVRQYSRAMAIEPTDVGFLLMAKALEQQGHSDEARALNERVARYSPDLAAAQRQVDDMLNSK